MNGTKSTTARGRGRGRGRGSRGRGRGRGRGKKVPKVMSSDEEESPNEEADIKEEPEVAPVVETKEVKEEVEAEPAKLEVPADISKLEAPVFTTIQRGPPEPMLRLEWTHKATLIGEKVLNPMIYCCELCSKPILIYGRMIPCKHVFCLQCARLDHTNCPRCREKILRVEQAGLGSVFMCTHAGTRYGNTGCRRTYLSQRDLQAHVKHRHVPASAEAMRIEPPPAAVAPPVQAAEPIKSVPVMAAPASSADPRAAAAARRSNLITVPIQDYTAPAPVPPPFTSPAPQTDVSVPPPQFFGPYSPSIRQTWLGQPYYR